MGPALELENYERETETVIAKRDSEATSLSRFGSANNAQRRKRALENVSFSKLNRIEETLSELSVIR